MNLAPERRRDQHADVSRTAIVLPIESGEQLLDMPAVRPARGMHSGRAAERTDLDAGVVREHHPAAAASLRGAP